MAAADILVVGAVDGTGHGGMNHAEDRGAGGVKATHTLVQEW